MFVRTEHDNCQMHINKVHHLFALRPLIHTVYYSLVEETELI